MVNSETGVKARRDLVALEAARALTAPEHVITEVSVHVQPHLFVQPWQPQIASSLKDGADMTDKG